MQQRAEWKIRSNRSKERINTGKSQRKWVAMLYDTASRPGSWNLEHSGTLHAKASLELGHKYEFRLSTFVQQ